MAKLRSSLRDLPDVVAVGELVDPVVAAVGHPVRSVYAERFWLPLVGPTGLWLLIRLADVADVADVAGEEGVPVVAAELAAEVGVASRRLGLVLERLEQFGFVAYSPPGILRVRRWLPPLTRRQAERLPAHLAAQLAVQRPARTGR